MTIVKQVLSAAIDERLSHLDTVRQDVEVSLQRTNEYIDEANKTVAEVEELQDAMAIEDEFIERTSS